MGRFADATLLGIARGPGTRTPMAIIARECLITDARVVSVKIRLYPTFAWVYHLMMM